MLLVCGDLACNRTVPVDYGTEYIAFDNPDPAAISQLSSMPGNDLIELVGKRFAITMI